MAIPWHAFTTPSPTLPRFAGEGAAPLQTWRGL
jgi:hypothetical protein